MAVGVVAVLAAGLAVAAQGQFIGKTPQPAPHKALPVEYMYPEQVHLPAGKPAAVALHFRVVEGMHINSHSPHDSFLIPATFSIPADEGVRLEAVSFQPGSDISLPSAPKMKINVYTGEFTVNARMVAARGNHLVQGKLHFQACNETQCLPPQTITAAIDVVAK